MLLWNDKIIGPVATKEMPMHYHIPEGENHCKVRSKFKLLKHILRIIVLQNEKKTT